MNLKSSSIPLLFKIAFLTASVIILITPAIINGYPLLHGDSGVVIISGFEHFAPIERPISYGIFVWMTSLELSLWFTILWQAAITVFVVDVLLNRVLEKEACKYTFAASLLLASTTSMAIFVCQIKPDFYLPLITLSICAYFFGQKTARIEDLLLLAIILIGSISHLSHLPITTGLVMSAVILSVILRKKGIICSAKKVFTMISILLAAWLIAPSLNYFLTGSFSLSRVSNVFRVSKLIQAGIFKEYVNDRCRQDSTFYLCRYKDELKDYKTYMDFLWDEDSFLYDDECQEKGRQYCWIARNDEFGLLINDIQSQSKYIKMIVNDGVKASATQLVTITIPDYASYQKHSYPMEMARKFLPADRKFLDKAKQSRQELAFPVLNMAQMILIIVSLIFTAIYFINFKTTIKGWKIIFLGSMVALTLIGNATFVGIFAGIAERFQSRIAWLIPFYACILLLDYFMTNKKRSVNYTSE
jgi:hypothetical protein